jgi:hypothetical protein
LKKPTPITRQSRAKRKLCSKAIRKHRAQSDGRGAAEPSVCDEAAEDRGQVNQGGISAEDGRCERLPAEAAEQALHGLDPDDILDVAGQQQFLGHVEHQQRLHGVVGEALPSLGKGQIAEPARMAEEGAVVVIDDVELRCGFGSGHAAPPSEEGSVARNGETASRQKPAGKAPCPSRPDIAAGDCQPRGDGDGFCLARTGARGYRLSAQVPDRAAKARRRDEGAARRDEDVGQAPLSSSVKPIFKVT